MRELRLTAPYDLALACFDDFDWADLVPPGLTAMRQQIDRMGTRSVDVLLASASSPRGLAAPEPTRQGPGPRWHRQTLAGRLRHHCGQACRHEGMTNKPNRR